MSNVKISVNGKNVLQIFQFPSTRADQFPQPRNLLQSLFTDILWYLPSTRYPRHNYAFNQVPIERESEAGGGRARDRWSMRRFPLVPRKIFLCSFNFQSLFFSSPHSQPPLWIPARDSSWNFWCNAEEGGCVHGHRDPVTITVRRKKHHRSNEERSVLAVWLIKIRQRALVC